MLILGVGLCLQWSCSTGAETSFEKSDRFLQSIENFEDQREISRHGLGHAYFRIDTILQNYDAEQARPLTLAFEEVWTGVLERIGQLKASFDQVNRRSSAYFSMLDEITSGIQDEQLKQRESQLNQQMKKEWEVTLQQAAEKLQAIDELLAGGNDLFKVMLVQSLRASISKEIVALKGITKEAEQLLADLQKLSHEGMKLMA
ncbi:hypothetical protein [Flavilitoribacter nigricans]|nr:hypothetical protein [Flavilitoribacter nigricans]